MKKFLHLIVSACISVVFHFRRVSLERRLTQICQRKEVLVDFDVKELILNDDGNLNRGELTIVESRFQDETAYYKHIGMFKQLFDMYGYVSKVIGPAMSVTMKHLITKIEVYYPNDDELKNTFISKLIYSQIREAHSGVKKIGDDR